MHLVYIVENTAKIFFIFIFTYFIFTVFLVYIAFIFMLKFPVCLLLIHVLFFLIE